MALEDDQLSWLEAATKGKHRFKRNAINKEFEAYKRRRDKAATARDLLDPNDPTVAVIDQGLKAADAEAANGKFDAAYKSLDSIKKTAKAAAAGRSDVVITDDLKMHANILTHQVAADRARVDQLVQRFNALLTQARNHPTVASAPTLDAAIAARSAFVATEAMLTVALTTLMTEANACAAAIRSHDLNGRVQTAETLIAALRKSGRDAGIDPDAQRVAAAKQVLASNGGRYGDASVISNLASGWKAELKARLDVIRSFGNYQQKEGEGTTPDAKTDTIRGQLKPTDNRIALLAREEQRVRDAIVDVEVDTILDEMTLADTSRQPINPAPDRPKFDLDGVIGAVSPIGPAGEDGKRPHVSLRAVEDAKAAAVAGLRQAVAAAAGDAEKMFDLTLKGPGEFMAMLRDQVLPGVRTKNMTENEKILLKDVSDALFKEVCALAPNKLSGDRQTLNMGGTQFQAAEVLGVGGNGQAQRYVDPVTGRKIVVKSLLNPDASKRKAMAYEMEVHNRLAKALPGGPDDPIVGFHGAALGDDGNLYMIMDEVDGGELDDEAAIVSAMENSGMIPPDAREMLAADTLKRTVEAMKQLEALGLVHADLKDANVMMTSDGKVKVIDFGSSVVGDAQGNIKKAAAAGTPNYDAFDKQPSTKSDEYSVGIMIRKLVGQMKPQRWGNQNIKFGDRGTLPDDMKDDDTKTPFQGALGTLLSAVENEDPDKRPSYEAILASSLMTRDSRDVSPEDMKDLRGASLEMAKQMRGMSTRADPNAIAAKHAADPRFAGVDMTNLLKDFVDPAGQVKIVKAQKQIADLDDTIRANTIAVNKETNEDRRKERAAELKAALLQRMVLQNDIINPAMEERAAAGEREYQAAMANPGLQVTFAGVKGNVTLAIAAAAKQREDNITKITKATEMFYKAVSEADAKDVDMTRVDRINQLMTALDAECKAIEAAIHAAVGPDAKFFLSRRKMVDVGKRFGKAGGSGGTATPPPRDELTELLAWVTKLDETAAVQEAAR